jgi:hypothetical protein
MKKPALFVVLFAIAAAVFGQENLDLSQYEETTLSYVELWEKIGTETTSKKFKVSVFFLSQNGNNLWFYDFARNKLVSFGVTRLWSTLEQYQMVTIYFVARKSKGSGERLIIDYIDGKTSLERPWLPYIDDGKPNKKGWYLKSLGNGRYEEIFYE